MSREPSQLTNEEAFGLIAQLLERPEKLTESELEAFDGMLARDTLSDKQRKWVQDSATRLELYVEKAVNAWSDATTEERKRIRG